MIGTAKAIQHVKSIQSSLENDDPASAMNALSKFIATAAPTFFVQQDGSTEDGETGKRDNAVHVKRKNNLPDVNTLRQGPAPPAGMKGQEEVVLDEEVSFDDLEEEVKSLSKVVHKPRGKKKVKGFNIDWKTFVIETVTRFLDMWRQAKDSQEPLQTDDQSGKGTD